MEGMKLVLLGPPGSGKGTQAQRLAAHFQVKAIATGDILREAVRRSTPLGAKAKEFMEKGLLVPDEVLIPMVKEHLAGLDGFVLDGFPRTVAQAAALDTIAPEAVAVQLDLGAEDLIGRLSGRRVCPSCNALYHVVNAPPRKADTCDRCSTRLVQREDDRPDVVRKRSEVYQEQTAPVAERYRRTHRLHSVDGRGSADAVFQRILRAIGY